MLNTTKQPITHAISKYLSSLKKNENKIQDLINAEVANLVHRNLNGPDSKKSPNPVSDWSASPVKSKPLTPQMQSSQRTERDHDKNRSS